MSTIVPSNTTQPANINDWLSHFIHRLFETIRGERSLSHINNVLSAQVLARVKRLSSLIQRALTQPNVNEDIYKNPVIRKVYVTVQNTMTLEIAVVVEDRHRVRSVALRIENKRNLWQVTRLEIG